MAAFICPTCGSDTSKLIAPGNSMEYEPVQKLACPQCYKLNYHQKVGLHDSFPGSQSKGLTNGKAWEIENRIPSPDDKRVIINRLTGKETQY